MEMSMAMATGYASQWAGGGNALDTRPAIFIDGGQSNSTSRAPWDSGEDYPTDGSVLQVGRSAQPYTDNADGEIVNAVRPLDHLSAGGGGYFGWALQFVLDFRAAYPGRPIILIPCGETGTSFSGNDWNPGDVRYEDMVSRTLAVLEAYPNGVLEALLWHQGENDSAMTEAAYEAALHGMFDALRSDLSHLRLPIVLGQLAPDYTAPNPKAVIAATPAAVPWTGLADSTGLSTFDGVHFNAPSMRTLGSRYFAAFAAAKANGTAPIVPDAPSISIITPGDGELDISWNEPEFYYDPVTDYAIRYSTDEATWTTVDDGVSTSTSLTITGLTNETLYYVQVAAISAAGQGAWSASATETPSASAPPGAEAGATTHWLLGSDGSELAGAAPVAIGTAPTQNVGYVSWSDTALRGYDTGVSDASQITVCAVIRYSSTTENSVWGGNGSFGTGRFAFIRGSDGVLRVRTNPDTYNVASGLLSANEWRFVAYSFDGATLNALAGDATSPVTYSATVSAGTPTGTIAAANKSTDNAIFYPPLDMAEFIVIEGAKTTAELQAIYDRSVLRMADRGITVE